MKSLTSYGAFVDIGGIDGMIHISELSWNRIKHPSEVVKVGDTVEVTIKKLDDENKKISLGFKKLEDNPWEILKRDYPVGTVVDAKIVGLAAFGAFANVIPAGKPPRCKCLSPLSRGCGRPLVFVPSPVRLPCAFRKPLGFDPSLGERPLQGLSEGDDR